MHKASQYPKSHRKPGNCRPFFCGFFRNGGMAEREKKTEEENTMIKRFAKILFWLALTFILMGVFYEVESDWKYIGLLGPLMMGWIYAEWIALRELMKEVENGKEIE